jgi:hypothetical protein
MATYLGYLTHNTKLTNAIPLTQQWLYPINFARKFSTLSDFIPKGDSTTDEDGPSNDIFKDYHAIPRLVEQINTLLTSTPNISHTVAPHSSANVGSAISQTAVSTSPTRNFSIFSSVGLSKPSSSSHYIEKLVHLISLISSPMSEKASLSTHDIIDEALQKLKSEEEQTITRVPPKQQGITVVSPGPIATNNTISAVSAISAETAIST